MMMELKDTVSLMLSDDYKDRVKAEYLQLSIRIEKLKQYIQANPNAELHKRQLNSMMLYLSDLCARLVTEGIDVKGPVSVKKQMLFD